jgi:hypothetical protein
MRNNGRGLGFGILLLTVGAVWLLSIAKIVTWATFNALFTLWPLVLVAIGIGFIFRSNRIVRTLTWLVLLAVVIGYGYINPAKDPWIRFDSNAANVPNTTVTLEKSPQTEKADLTLDYGAMQINIDSEGSGLLDASINNSIISHSVEELDNRTKSIKFEMKNKSFIDLSGINKLRSDYHLSRDVVWNLMLNTGAIDADLDLGGLKVEKLDIKTGVSSLNLDMGSCNTVMKIESGASKIDISLPDDTGMKIRIDGGLNNSNLEKNGWAKENNLYYSPDYNSKDFKIEAEINNGLGDLSVENR